MSRVGTAAGSAGAALAGVGLAALGMTWLLLAAAGAAPVPVEDLEQAPKKEAAADKSRVPPPPPLQISLPPRAPGGDSDAFRSILRASAARSPADTMGNGLYEVMKEAFYAGKFDEALARAQEFTRTYTRNLNLNDALELVLLARGFRDFEEGPLRAYARVLAHREAGRADSAAAIAKAALERWPGARVRHHLRFQLAELAAERGDHRGALAHALAVADSTSKSRLAPAALKLAGDETLASGQGPENALKLYQELLERFPESPLAPGVRAQVLEMRKKLQL